MLIAVVRNTYSIWADKGENETSNGSGGVENLGGQKIMSVVK